MFTAKVSATLTKRLMCGTRVHWFVLRPGNRDCSGSVQTEQFFINVFPNVTIWYNDKISKMSVGQYSHPRQPVGSRWPPPCSCSCCYSGTVKKRHGNNPMSQRVTIRDTCLTHTHTRAVELFVEENALLCSSPSSHSGVMMFASGGGLPAPLNHWTRLVPTPTGVNKGFSAVHVRHHCDAEA